MSDRVTEHTASMRYTSCLHHLLALSFIPKALSSAGHRCSERENKSGTKAKEEQH